jgi:L-fucose isomerase-like protein
MLAQNFDGPVMFCAAAEESSDRLVGDRGDAYCGVLNASYNLKLRNVKVYIPEYPVGDAEDCAEMLHEFMPIARAIYGLKNLKIISFGPRPKNFMACNAPIKQLYNLGVELEENSELDLFEAFHKHAGDKRIPEVVADMERELGEGNKKPEILEKLAQYELTLLDWVETHKECRKYVAIAGKCWPAFQTQFGFVPCYVNSRLTGKGIPVSCEVDIYGCLSEYIGTCISEDVVTLLDINNSVPKDMYKTDIQGKFNYQFTDTFMGFHCGNTCSKKVYLVQFPKLYLFFLAIMTDRDILDRNERNSDYENDTGRAADTLVPPLQIILRGIPFLRAQTVFPHPLHAKERQERYLVF